MKLRRLKRAAWTIPAALQQARESVGPVIRLAVVAVGLSLGLATTLTAATAPLEWDPNSEPDLAGYNVYRSQTSGAGYVKINTALVTTTTYDDDTIQYGVTYYYVVTAVNTAGLESGFSNELAVLLDNPNGPPTAVNDMVSTLEDSPVTVDVLANDYDPDADALSVVSVSPGSLGQTSVNPDQTVAYQPLLNLNGTDNFSYIISDGNGNTASATVTVTITPRNDAPQAGDDEAVTQVNRPVTVAVLGNDTDPENDSLSVIAVTPGQNGSTVLNSDSTITYTPNSGYLGNDAFAYTVTDGNGGTDVGNVAVRVLVENDPPAPADDAATTEEDQPVVIAVLANDTDPDGDALIVSQAGPAGNGSVVVNSDNTVTYTPQPDFNGTDTFIYTVDDGKEGTGSATVTLTVTPVEDAPVANADSVSTQEDKAVTIDVLANDSDADGDPLTVSQFNQPSRGAVKAGPGGKLIYTPGADFNGADSFTYRAGDGTLESEDALVQIQVIAVNDPPEADAGRNQKARGGERVDLQGTGSDPDGNQLTFQWTQLSGPQVQLENAQNRHAWFTAPSTSKTETVVLELEVSDGQATDSDSVRVVINPDRGKTLVIPAGLSVDNAKQRGTFVGTAVLNPGDAPNEVVVKKTDADGQEMGADPVATLMPGEQQTFLASQLVGAGEVSTLIFEGLDGDLEGFFMVGTNRLDGLDGVSGQLDDSTELFFPAAGQGGEHTTKLFLFNPGNEPTAVQLELLDAAGVVQRSQEFPLAAQGTLTGNLNDLFPGVQMGNGYLAARAEEPLQGFELVSDGFNLAAYAARKPGTSGKLLVPHFFYDPDRGSTEIRLINPGDQGAAVVLNAWDDLGQRLAQARVRIAPRELFTADLAQLLQLPGGEAVSGYLDIEVTDGLFFAVPIIGAVSFSGNGGRFMAALPVLEEPAEHQRFLHVAQSPEQSIFTGLALLNPGESPVQVEVQIYTREGEVSAQKTLTIGARERAVDVLNGERFFGAGFKQVSGHIEIRSSAPIAAFALFGDYHGEFMSAISAQKVEPD